MQRRHFIFSVVVFVIALVALFARPGVAAAEAPGVVLAALDSAAIHGRVVSAETGRPLAGAQIRIVELGRRELAHGDGEFHFERLPAGQYTLEIEYIGHRTLRREVEVEAGQVVWLDVVLDFSPIQLPGFVVTGTVGARAGEEAIRPTNVVAGQTLARELGGTVAATLEGEAGISVASSGPATARPVIRGLSGDRILVLEDGQRVGDLSATSSDHAVAIDPISARRIEVVRGPSALLYGSNALGGVVNVVREEVPASLPDRPTGTFSFQGESVNEAFVGEGSVVMRAFGPVALRFEGSARTTEDLKTPLGVLDNTWSRTYNAGVGAGWVNGWGHAGAAYRYFESSYGVPGGSEGGHAEGVEVRMNRHTVKGRAEIHEGVGPFSSLDIDGAYTRYHHQEIEHDGALGTEFGLLTAAGEVLGRHEGWGPLDHGAVGFRVEWSDFATGGSLGTPPAREYALAGYTVQELDLDPFRIEFGARFDWRRIEPLDTITSVDIGRVRTRDFGSFSGSIGALYELSDGVRLGASVARAYRTPAIGELFSEGPHLASHSFEVGDPDLEAERGLGADVFLRIDRDRFQAEVAAFRNRIDDYIYPRNTGRVQPGVGLPIYQHANADAELTGIEASAQWVLTPHLVADATASYVRGTLTDTDEPLPFMPPLQGGVNLRYETESFFAGAGWKGAAEQDRVGEFETPTDGYNVFSASAGYRWTLWGRIHTLTLRIDNLTDEVYRNHLSRIKDIMPEAGRSVSLLYRLTF